MGWKYIVIEADFGMPVKFPVIFPDKLVHKDVFQRIRACAPLRSRAARCVSAGKIEHLEVDGLGGGSETLRLKSNPDDVRMIDSYSYTHGVI